MTAGQERLVVLLGFPLGHSLSPAIHNASFRAQNLPFRYEARPVGPTELGETVRQLKDAGFAGANVTVPHKQAILQFVDAVSATVEAVGAANTLVWREDAAILFADNTDVGGFLVTLAGSPYLHGSSVILGSGGSARAVAFGLASSAECTGVTIAARSEEKADTLIRSLPARLHNRLHATTIGEAASAIHNATLIVNATPVGMSPNVGDSPLPSSIKIGAGQLAYDLVYNPSETRFLREARLGGAETMGGLEMLFQQAALSFRMWTGHEMDLDPARAVLNP